MNKFKKNLLTAILAGVVIIGSGILVTVLFDDQSCVDKNGDIIESSHCRGLSQFLIIMFFGFTFVFSIPLIYFYRKSIDLIENSEAWSYIEEIQNYDASDLQLEKRCYEI